MAPRAIWKGHLKIGALACAVGLYSAASTSDRVAFRTVNRQTRNPLQREYVDVDTEEPVPPDDQVKGYETEQDQFVILEPEELAKAVPDSDKILHVDAFLDCPNIDTAYLDKPYYLAPASRDANTAFALIREGMRVANTAALARATLFRRVRTVLIRAQGPGLVANTLNFDYEVRSTRQAFRSIPDHSIADEMLDLAKHIIKTKSGDFDPATFNDRYDDALAELVRAKAEGRAVVKPERPEPKVVSLLDALREAAGATASDTKPARKAKSAPKSEKQPPQRRKAG
jgi:DNA end-binding protein Ku